MILKSLLQEIGSIKSDTGLLKNISSPKYNLATGSGEALIENGKALLSMEGFSHISTGGDVPTEVKKLFYSGDPMGSIPDFPSLEEEAAQVYSYAFGTACLMSSFIGHKSKNKPLHIRGLGVLLVQEKQEMTMSQTDSSFFI